MSALRPILVLANCLCLRFERQYASSVSFEISIPMVSSIVFSSPCLVMRAQSPRIRSGRQKRRRRPYSATVHYDQEGNGPTSAAARHGVYAGQQFQLRTGTAQVIRQEGMPPYFTRHL